jgi:hypothetical protein
MPFKDEKKRKEYKKNYDLKNKAFLHQAKLAAGIPIDLRKKQSVDEKTDSK